jgi:hypothetical protein
MRSFHCSNPNSGGDDGRGEGGGGGPGAGGGGLSAGSGSGVAGRSGGSGKPSPGGSGSTDPFDLGARARDARPPGGGCPTPRDKRRPLERASRSDLAARREGPTGSSPAKEGVTGEDWSGPRPTSGGRGGVSGGSSDLATRTRAATATADSAASRAAAVHLIASRVRPPMRPGQPHGPLPRPPCHGFRPRSPRYPPRPFWPS